MYGKTTKTIALTKLMRYCAYQDRCHSEVRYKLLDLGLRGYDVEEVISRLITEGFLNEERFARSYVRGKFGQKQWGRNKILQGLSHKQVSPYCIQKGLEEIDDQEYQDTLQQLASQKWKLLKERNPFTRRQKLANYLIRKGYEPELVWNHIRKIYPIQS